MAQPSLQSLNGLHRQASLPVSSDGQLPIEEPPQTVGGTQAWTTVSESPATQVSPHAQSAVVVHVMAVCTACTEP
ncbi:hypothetical protein P3T76_002398 [Phytophthora citrophthora]|uniref:Uncharacterized protein n=1 Tax=Phytophthora citrophthora TaxID=4793 RepID=A0AAD9GZQ2_9STRA|nr:hypothetical protein P3T76_002398 [Phytophthora citrophthora]